MTIESTLALHTKLTSFIETGETFAARDQFRQASAADLSDFFETCVAPFVMDPQVERYAVPEFIQSNPDGKMMVPLLDSYLANQIEVAAPFGSVWMETCFRGPQQEKIDIGCLMTCPAADQLVAMPLMSNGDTVIIPGLAYVISRVGNSDKGTLGVVDIFQREQVLAERPEVDLYELILYHFLDFYRRTVAPP